MKYKHIRSQNKALLFSLGLLPLALFALGFLFSPSPPQKTSLSSALPKVKNLVLAASTSQCSGGFEVVEFAGQLVCTHGSDPAPKGVNIDVDQPPESQQSQVADGGAVVNGASVSCFGDGQDGKRVQLIYARASDKPDRYNQYAESFQAWAQEMNNAVRDSAVKTGGYSQIRFVHDNSCAPSVARVQLTPSGDDAFDQTVYELMLAGYSRSDRKYMVWVDANVYCGLGTIAFDDKPGPTNRNNTSASWSRVDTGCWGIGGAMVETHELTHMLGGVQKSAPNSDAYGHCIDEHDRLCYAARAGVVLKYICSASQERLLDCNNNDYFTTERNLTSYLSTHWNVAESGFLQTEFASSDPARVYRFWSDKNQNHFYTASYAEAGNLVKNSSKDWRLEGTSFRASTSPGCVGKTPVYRFWSKRYTAHFYTASPSEKTAVINNYDDDTWRFEGTAFCAHTNSSGGQKPLYRFWSTKHQSHFYTSSEVEKNQVANDYDDYTWRFEGVVYYVDQ